MLLMHNKPVEESPVSEVEIRRQRLAEKIASVKGKQDAEKAKQARKNDLSNATPMSPSYRNARRYMSMAEEYRRDYMQIHKLLNEGLSKPKDFGSYASLEESAAARASGYAELVKQRNAQDLLPDYETRAPVDISALAMHHQVTASRYVVRNVIFIAQFLYETNAYAQALVLNIVTNAIGVGHKIQMEDEILQTAFDRWTWNPADTQSTLYDLEKMAGISLVRDGSIFGNWLPNDDNEPKIKFIDALHIWSIGGGPRVQAGIKIDDHWNIIGFIYNPLVLPVGSVDDREFKEFTPEEIIYTYRQEYAGDIRGLSWIRNSLLPLYELKAFHALLKEAMELSVITPGYWTADLKLMEYYSGDESAEQSPEERTKKAQDNLSSLSEIDVHRWSVVPEGMTFNPMELAGITDSNAIKYIENIIIRQIARGSEVSGYGVSADFNDVGPNARYAIQNDIKLYQQVGYYIEKFLTETVDRWIDDYKRRYPKFEGSTKYEIVSSGFQYVDPLKDSQADNIKASNGVYTPQQWARDQNQNWASVKAEWEEYAEFVKYLRDEYGFDMAGVAVQKAKGMGTEEKGPPEQTDDEFNSLGNDQS